MDASSLLSNLRARGFNLSVEAEMVAIVPFSRLTEFDKEAIREHKAEVLELLASTRLCAICAGELRLQDRAEDAWYCPNCRKWCDGQGRALARIETAKPTTRDEADARKLIEDLKAAGCAFVIEDGELRLRFLSRMSAGLWTRFENAGAVFKAMAKGEAEV
jgi:ribosomal protein L37AE/L43A